MTARHPPVSSLELGANALPAMDVVFIEGFTGNTVIGIHDSELHQPQPIVVDVHAGRPHARACDTDQIADTIDYGAVRLRLQALSATAPTDCSAHCRIPCRLPSSSARAPTV